MNMKLGIAALAFLLIAAQVSAYDLSPVYLDAQQTAQLYVWDDGSAKYIGPAIDGFADSGYVPYVPDLAAIPQIGYYPNGYSSLG